MCYARAARLAELVRPARSAPRTTALEGYFPKKNPHLTWGFFFYMCWSMVNGHKGEGRSSLPLALTPESPLAQSPTGNFSAMP